MLHTLYYPGEMHKANKQTAPAKTSANRKELDLATQLIRQLAGPFNPEQFHDTYKENVEKLIGQKQKGQKVTAAPKAKRAPVVDLMEALKRSLQAKPAAGAKTKHRSKAA